MRIQATYACEHDATREFDGRNRGAADDAKKWPGKAAERVCGACRRSNANQILNGMNAQRLREIISGLLTYRAVIDRITNEDGTPFVRRPAILQETVTHALAEEHRILTSAAEEAEEELWGVNRF